MIDRGEWLARAGVAAFMGLMLWQGTRSAVEAITGEAEGKNALDPTPTWSPGYQQPESGRGNLTVESAPPGYKAYTLIPGETVYYESVPDPMGEGRDCVEIGKYTPDDPHTLFGASVVVGPDSKIYVDIEGGTIHSSDGRIIGYFERSKTPEWSNVPGVNSESIVCANN